MKTQLTINFSFLHFAFDMFEIEKPSTKLIPYILQQTYHESLHTEERNKFKSSFWRQRPNDLVLLRSRQKEINKCQFWELLQELK